MVKARTCDSNKVPSPQDLHRDDSHEISKFKPKIRIIHIFAPEIIKTDVANFRELVQRLTGKPSDSKAGKKKAKSIKREESKSVFCNNPAEKIQFRSLGFDERIKEEEEEDEGMWGSDKNNTSGFLSGLGDLDGFIQGFNEFPLPPLNAVHMDVFGETHFS